MNAITHSQHYVGEKGKQYFEFQNEGGLQRGRINARKFFPYVKKTDRVLDFGCADGALLSQLDCATRIGVEINPAARSAAIKNGIDAVENLSDVADKSCDLIVSNHALEHVPQPLDQLREMKKKLVTGGRLAICLPIDDWRAQKKFHGTDINNHLYTWTPKLLGNLLTEAGFCVENTKVYTHAWPRKYWMTLDQKLPIWFFDICCNYVSWRDKSRQVIGLAMVGNERD